MKTAIILLLVTAGVISAATDWQWEASFAVGPTGMVRLELPAQVLDVSRLDLGDVRVYSPEKKETPYLIERPVRRDGAARDGVGMRVNQFGTITTVEVSTGTSERVEAVELISPAQELLKSVTIEGNHGGEWQTLAKNEVIFRSGGTERLRVPISADSWQGFRFTVDDSRTQAVPFTGVRLITAGKIPVSAEMPITLGQREEVANETRLTLDLGARNLDVAELRFEIADAVFSRRCSLGYSVPTSDGESRMETFASGTIYRAAGNHGVSTEELVIPIHRRIPARFIVATLRNGSSPPLTVSGGKVHYYPTILAFYAGVAGEWGLVTGKSNAVVATYDLNELRGAVSKAGGEILKPGSLRQNPSFVAAEPLPGVKISGATIDLADWSRRRVVSAPGTGVVLIELDAKVLADSRTDLGDLRLVQSGRQIPYLSKPGTVFHDIKPLTISLANDPKCPKISRWEIMLPLDGVPVVDFTVHSPALLFTRRFSAFVERKDDVGNKWRDEVGAANWMKSSSNDAALVMDLREARLPAKFFLETNDGDNLPITLDEMSLRYAAPSIIAKLSDVAPLFLYYGNPKAAPPQYDLQVVRKEMLAAQPLALALGDVEKLRPDTHDHRAPDAGSPWLWLALAGVVAVLLVIVAKLMPASPIAKSM